MSLPRPSALPFVRVRARALSAVACLLVVLGGLTPGGGLATARAQSLPLPLQQTLTGGYPFGSAVAVDGALLAVGEQPRVRTFVRSGGLWTPAGTLGDGSVLGFGNAVAMSGTTLVVGATAAVNPGGVSTGAVFVYDWNGASWVLATTLFASDGVNGAAFGTAVATSGQLVVVGAPTVSHGQGVQGTGKVYVFDRNAAWAEERLPLDPRHANFGRSVSVSGDTVCVGSPFEAPGGTTSQGAAWVYTRASGTWDTGDRLTAPDHASADQFGVSCAIDGNRLAVGAIGVDETLTDQGAAYTFTRSAGVWTFEAQVFASSPTQGDGFGSAVALRNDTLVVASNPLNVAGTTRAFTRTGTQWIEAQQIPDGTASNASSIGFDGTSLAIGVPAVSGPGSYVRVFASGPQAPGAPQSLAVAGAGSTVQFTWGAPVVGGAPTDYRLRARVGGQIVFDGSVGLTQLFRTAAPNGTYSVTALASNAVGTSVESNAVTVTVPVTATPPAAPSGLTANVTGATATLSWTAPAGSFVENYVVLAGATPGFTAPIASVPASASPLVVPGVPPGVYFVRVVAQNAAGFSGASNEITLTVAPPSPPSAPTLNAPVKAGASVTLSWTPGATGGVPTSYELVVAATSGGAAIMAPVTLTGTSQTFGPVPAGTYFLRLRALNAAGTSPASNEVVLTMP